MKANERGEKEVSEIGEVNEDKDQEKEIIVIVNGSSVHMTGKSHYIFVDVFDFIEFDLSASAGRAIVTNLNDRPAEYMEPLKDNDKIDIFWKNIESK